VTSEREYILGTDRDELERLGLQHQAWVAQAYSIFARAGFREGDTLIDLGCGPGFTSIELARVVGPRGRVIARDESTRFLDFLRGESARAGLAQIEPSSGRVEDLDLPQASLDGAYARWLFCWLPDPGAALARVAEALKPGAAIAIQDYLDWGGMKLLPPSEVLDEAVLACMASWREGGSRIDVGEDLPALAQDCGLHVESFLPVARVGVVGSLEWRWLGTFFATYLPKLVERGSYGEGEFAAFRAEWEARTAQGTSRCYAPLMFDAVLRKP